jgi:hypothetical protein
VFSKLDMIGGRLTGGGKNHTTSRTEFHKGMV